MWAPISQASSRSIRAYELASWTLPARIDLISVPVRTRPASNVSSMLNSCRARRLSATVSSGIAPSCPIWVVCDRRGWVSMRRPVRAPERAHLKVRERGAQASTRAWPSTRDSRAQKRRSYSDRRFKLSHPQGVRLDGHLLRGGAATRTVDHCTSPPFVPDYRTRWSRVAQAEIASPGRGGRGSRIEQLDGLVESRVLAGSEVRRRGHDDIRDDPDVVDPGLVRRQPFCDRQLQRARLRQLDPLLDRALAERCLADDRRSPTIVEGAGDDLTGGGAPTVDEHDEADGGIGRGPGGLRVGRGVGLGLGSVGGLLPEQGPGAQELAGDAPCGGHVAAGVAAQVEDDLLPADSDVRLVNGVKLRSGVVGEASHADIADRPICEDLVDDLPLGDDAADDRHVERGLVAARDREDDRRVLRAADAVAGGVDGQAVERGTVDCQDCVASQEAGLLGRRTLDRADHDELAVRAEGRTRARRTGRILRSDLGPDTLELARQVLEPALVLLWRQVGRVRVAEAVDHPLDRATDERLLIDLAAGVAPLDRPIGVPERLELVGLGRRRARLLGRPLARSEEHTSELQSPCNL